MTVNNQHPITFRPSTSAFADDTLWLESNKEDIQQTIDTSNEFFTINDIKINGDKSKFIVLNNSQTADNNCVTIRNQSTIVHAKTNLVDIRFLSIYLREKKAAITLSNA